MICASINEKNRIELRGPYNDALQEFYHSLPGARWDKMKACWVVHLTPAACYRILFEAPMKCECEERIRNLALKFYQPVLSGTASDEQPEIRNKDAWRHQVAAYQFALQREATLLWMAMGTGKSLVTVQLLENWKCQRVAILCPKAVMGVWRREFAKHATQEWVVTVADKGSQERKVAAAILDSISAAVRRLPWVLVVNYETARTGAMGSFLTQDEWSCVVLDESHRAKGHGTAIGKFVSSLGDMADRRLALSGTPMAHSPMDVFGQFRFLDKGIFGDSYHRFRNLFAISGHFGADHIVGYKNQEELARRMNFITYQVGAEVLDLPEATHVEIEIELTAKTRRIYDEMEEDLCAFVDAGGEITAANGLVKMLRCLQICGGNAVLDSGEQVVVGNEKAEALADLLEDLDEPVVVACQFKHDLAMVEQVADKLKRTYGEVSGNRKDLTPHSTMPENVEIMGVQIASGGVGIDLTRARVMVIYSPGYSLGQYDQLLARVHRPGQSRPVVYYHLVAKNTVNEAVYKSLRAKRDVIETVRAYLKGESND